MIQKDTIGNYLRAACELARAGAASSSRDAQDRRLRKLVRHAHAAVPYYRRLFDRAGVRPDEIRCAADLVRLPISTKAELRRQPIEELTAVGANLERCWRTTSSGTSGTPFSAYRDAGCSCLFFALTARALRMAGARVTDKLMVIGPGYYPEGLWVQRLGFGRVRSLSPLQEASQLAAGIAAYRPGILHCYASVLKALIAHWQTNGLGPHSLRVIVASADFLDERTRRDCAELTGVNPIQMYGAVETGRIGSECRFRNGIHIYTDFVIPEFVPSEDGACRVVLTDLTNFIMPFIRYDQGDLAEVMDGSCPCGLQFPRMKLLRARRSDVVRLPGGGVISALRVGAPLWDMPGVDEFKIVQESLGRLVVKLVSKNHYDEQAVRVALAQIESLLPCMRVELQIVPCIPRNTSGKFTHFRAELPPSVGEAPFGKRGDGA